MGLTNFIITVAGVSAVVLLLRTDVKQSASIFKRNVKHIRTWLEEETANSSKMVKFSISNARYIYVHDQKYLSEDVDIHHIVSRKSITKSLCVYTLAFLVLACSICLYVHKEKSISLVLYSLLFDILLVKLLLGKPVKKESVVIMPAFGVQLETHYMSGKVIRCFVPIDKILKPVLVECVTAVTCYWTLSLIVRGEPELVLVFKSLRPPVKMLVHVWKALCAATGSKEEACTHAE